MRRYFSDIANWPAAVLAALVGYGVALGGWSISHRAVLPAYIYENQLASPERLALLARLAAGALLGLVAWATASVALSRISTRPVALWLDFLTRTGILLFILPLLPVLSIPGLQSRSPVLTLGLILGVAGLAASTVRAVSLFRHAGDSAVLRLGSPTTPAATAPVSNNRPSRLLRDPALMLVLVLALGYAAFMSLVTVARHNAFGTHAFDLGIQAQTMYEIVHRGVPLTTLYGTGVINQFGDHFSPIYYLLVPLYAAWPDPRTLLIFQSLWLALGAVPVYLLARRRLGSRAVATVLAACYLLYPALHAVNQLDFHEIALATPLLLMALYLFDADRYGFGGLFMALATLCKEEVSLTGLAIGLYILLVKRRARVGAIVAVASFAYFVVVTRFVMPALGGGPDITRFTGMTAAPWTGFGGVLITALTNPVFTLSYALLDPEKALFLAQLLVPLIGLPLLAGAGSWLVALPGLATLLLSSYRNQYSLDAHYPAVVIPSLFFLAILGGARLQRHGRGVWPAAAASVLVVSLVMNQQYGWLWGKRFTGIPQSGPRAALVASFVAQVPPDASVGTLSDYVPHLANRDAIRLLPDLAGADYILFDARLGTNYFPLISRDPRGEAICRMYPLVATGEYGLVREEDGLLLLRRGQDASGNDRALAVLGSVTYDAASLPGAEGSIVVDDPDAASGRARFSKTGAAPGSPDAVRPVFGPYATLIPGRYRVEFRMKVADNALPGPVATIDVFSFAAGGVMSQQEIRAEQFNAANHYQVFSLDIRTDKLLQDVEFRVGHVGLTPLTIDTIAVNWLGRP